MTEPAPVPSDGERPTSVADGGQPFAEDRQIEAAAMARRAARARTSPPYQWPLTSVLIGLVASLGWVAADHFRRGSVLFAAVVCMAFLMRLLLRERDAGWLTVRSRMVDLACLGFLAVTLSVFSLIVPPPS